MAATDEAGKGASPSYILRGGDEGAARLRILGAATRPTTLRLLQRVGIEPGMRVLDLGCGSGEVAVELARLVGPAGRVTGIDADPSILEHARARAVEAGVQLELRVGDASTAGADAACDVVYARFLLSHLTDPAAAVARMRDATRPGGRIVVEDVDIPGHLWAPPSEAFARYVELYQAVARRRGVDPAIGPRLPRLLRDAGLEEVQVDVVQPTFLDGDGKRVAELTLAAIRTPAVEAGLATGAEIDRLVTELEEFRRDPGSLQSIARVVQAWATRAT